MILFSTKIHISASTIQTKQTTFKFGIFTLINNKDKQKQLLNFIKNKKHLKIILDKNLCQNKPEQQRNLVNHCKILFNQFEPESLIIKTSNHTFHEYIKNKVSTLSLNILVSITIGLSFGCIISNHQLTNTIVTLTKFKNTLKKTLQKSTHINTSSFNTNLNKQLTTFEAIISIPAPLNVIQLSTNQITISCPKISPHTLEAYKKIAMTFKKKISIKKQSNPTKTYQITFK